LKWILEGKTVLMKSQVICFIPCCASKNPSGRIEDHGLGLSEADLLSKWSQLIACRRGASWCLNSSSPLTSAINLYTGSPYDIINKSIIIQNIRAGRLRLIIISAGYGIVDAFEPIHEYEAVMKGRTATYWRECGLVDIISEYLLSSDIMKPLKVFGFFAGDVNWSTTGSKYRYFFTEGLRTAKKKGLRPQLSGCFYRQSGQGVKAILGALGRTFMNFVNYNFNDQFAIDIQQKARRDGNIIISFDKI